MTKLGTIAAGDVDLITWCKATDGKLVYDVHVNGRRFHLDIDENTTNNEKLDKISMAYNSIVSAEAAVPTVTIEVPAEDADSIRDIIASKGAGVLLVVPSSDVERVQKVVDKVIVVGKR